MLTSDPQFARATVNMIWAELMGVGIVDPPFDFDLDRQDLKNAPPAPWTIQPSHPELLEALAKDFVANNYSLRHIMRVITKSSSYQLSSHFAGEWRPATHDPLDLGGKELEDVRSLVAAFGQSNRDQGDKSLAEPWCRHRPC